LRAAERPPAGSRYRGGWWVHREACAWCFGQKLAQSSRADAHHRITALPCEWLYPACPRAQERPELAVLCYPRAASVRDAPALRPSSVVARRVLVRPQISCGLSRGRRVLATECHRQAPAQTSAYWRRTCRDRKSTRLNSSHVSISYAVF